MDRETTDPALPAVMLEPFAHLRAQAVHTPYPALAERLQWLSALRAMALDGEARWLGPEAEDGIAYVLNEDDAYVFVGRDVYEVVAGDNLWRIAERKLGSGTHYTDIRELNGLTSNAIRIGMKLLLP